jgi:hypothetical protein
VEASPTIPGCFFVSIAAAATWKWVLIEWHDHNFLTTRNLFAAAPTTMVRNVKLRVSLFTADTWNTTTKGAMPVVRLERWPIKIHDLCFLRDPVAAANTRDSIVLLDRILTDIQV